MEPLCVLSPEELNNLLGGGYLDAVKNFYSEMMKIAGRSENLDVPKVLTFSESIQMGDFGYICIVEDGKINLYIEYNYYPHDIVFMSITKSSISVRPDTESNILLGVILDLSTLKKAALGLTSKMVTESKSCIDSFVKYFRHTGKKLKTVIAQLKDEGFSDKDIYKAMCECLGDDYWVDF